jgi:hypothetical protein
MRRPEFLAKIDISPIISGHLKTLASARTGRGSFSDGLLFFGFPVVLGATLVAFGFGFRSDAVNGFLTAFSILTGLLLNLLVLVFSLSAASQSDHQLRKRILKEVFTNICYCILVAICAAGVALVDLGYMRSNAGAITGKVSTFLLAATTTNFVLTLLMVMKRMYRLISTELENSSSRGDKKAA